MRTIYFTFSSVSVQVTTPQLQSLASELPLCALSEGTEEHSQRRELFLTVKKHLDWNTSSGIMALKVQSKIHINQCEIPKSTWKSILTILKPNITFRLWEPVNSGTILLLWILGNHGQVSLLPMIFSLFVLTGVLPGNLNRQSSIQSF